jgi:endonuclease/exonuclease/phosphatase family metal-dependent hydrolase
MTQKTADDYIIVGDWNIENDAEWEITTNFISGFGYSLLKGPDDKIQRTNLNQKKPYDNIALCPSYWRSVGLIARPLIVHKIFDSHTPNAAQMFSDHFPISCTFSALNPG